MCDTWSLTDMGFLYKVFPFRAGNCLEVKQRQSPGVYFCPFDVKKDGERWFLEQHGTNSHVSLPSERQRELQQYLNSLISVSSKIAACPLHKAHTRSTPVIILTLEDYRFGRLTTFIEVFQGGFDIIRHLLSNEQRQPVRNQIAAFPPRAYEKIWSCGL